MIMNSDSDTSDSDRDEGNETPPLKKVKVVKRLQKYRSEWESTYSWVDKVPDSDYAAKCTICNITFNIGKSGIGQIKQHSETKNHNQKALLLKKSSTLDRFFGTAGSSTASSSNNDDDKITASELALTYHTVKHNLSYNSMDCNNKLSKIVYVDSKTALKIKLGRTKMEALVCQVLAPHALETVLDHLYSPDTYFCLQTDASNKKNIKLFPLVVQYFDVEKGVQNKLLDFYENPDESADGMFEAINKSLIQHKLSFDRVSGLSADNINANFGIHHSLFKNIENMAPHLIKGNCHAHIVHNTTKHAMGVLNCDVENIILKIYSHFSSSACRREELKKFVADVEGEWHELIRHVGTRWLSLLPCVDNILINWTALYNYFKSLDEDCPMLLQNILLMNEPEGENKIKAYLNFTSHILHNLHKAVKQLEGNNVTVIDVYNIMVTLKNALEQRKKEQFFGYETKKILTTIENVSKNMSEGIKRNFLLFIDKALAYLNKWFKFEETNWLYIIQKLNLKNDISFDDCDQILEKLNIQAKLNIQMDDLFSEIALLNEILAGIRSSDEHTKFSEMSTDKKWQYIFQKSDNDFKKLLKIISTLLSVPASSAFTERVFSIMKIKWREDRNRADINLIKSELLVNINLDVECSESFTQFLATKKILKSAQSQHKYKFKQ